MGKPCLQSHLLLWSACVLLTVPRVAAHRIWRPHDRRGVYSLDDESPEDDFIGNINMIDNNNHPNSINDVLRRVNSEDIDNAFLDMPPPSPRGRRGRRGSRWRGSVQRRGLREGIPPHLRDIPTGPEGPGLEDGPPRRPPPHPPPRGRPSSYQDSSPKFLDLHEQDILFAPDVWPQGKKGPPPHGPDLRDPGAFRGPPPHDERRPFRRDRRPFRYEDGPPDGFNFKGKNRPPFRDRGEPNHHGGSGEFFDGPPEFEREPGRFRGRFKDDDTLGPGPGIHENRFRNHHGPEGFRGRPDRPPRFRGNEEHDGPTRFHHHQGPEEFERFRDPPEFRSGFEGGSSFERRPQEFGRGRPRGPRGPGRFRQGRPPHDYVPHDDEPEHHHRHRDHHDRPRFRELGRSRPPFPDDDAPLPPVEYIDDSDYDVHYDVADEEVLDHQVGVEIDDRPRDFRRKRHHRPHPPFRPGHRLHREGRGPPDDDHDGIPRHSLDYADSIEIIDPNKAFPFYEYISDVGDPDFFGLHRVRDHGRLNAVDRPKFRPGFLLLPKEKEVKRRSNHGFIYGQPRDFPSLKDFLP